MTNQSSKGKLWLMLSAGKGTNVSQGGSWLTPDWLEKRNLPSDWSEHFSRIF